MDGTALNRPSSICAFQFVKSQTLRHVNLVRRGALPDTAPHGSVLHDDGGTDAGELEQSACRTACPWSGWV